MKNETRYNKRTSFRKWSLVSAALFGALQLGYAQDDEEEVFELSPFVVEGAEDEGYRASRTLAGGRTATNIKDVGTSIEVLTKDFLDDVGASNVEEFLQYTTGGEVGGSQGNMVGFSESQQGDADSTAARRNPSQNVRIRGIGRPDYVRNYYKTSIPMETYNTDRVDINRGANSMLFGLGSPAGLINSNYQRASFSNTSKVDVGVSNEGSFRTALNFNRELIEGKLAVRFATLMNYKKYRQKPSYRDDNRFFGAVTYKPFEGTTFRAHLEDGEIFGNAPDTLLPSQAIDSFIKYRTPIDAFYNLQHFGDPEGPNAEQYAAMSDEEKAMYVAPDSEARNVIGGGRMFGWAMVYDGQNGGDPTFAFQPELNSGFIEEGNPYWDPAVLADGSPNLGLVHESTPELKYYRNSRNATDANGPAQGFTNLDTFDFSRQNFGGNTDYYSHDFHTYNLSLEQIFFDGQAGFELGYDYEEKDNDAVTNFNGWKGEFTIDINKTLLLPALNPDGSFKTDGSGSVVSEAMPNPNFGRPFYLTEPNRSTSFEKRETTRATAFVKYDFEDKHNDSILKWLGRHTLTGLFDKSTEHFRNAASSHNTYSDTFNIGWQTGSGVAHVPSNGYRRTSKMVYMGPAIQTYIDNPFDPSTQISMSDIVLQPSTANLLDPNPVVPVTFWNLGPDAEGSNWTHIDNPDVANGHSSPHPNNYGTEDPEYTGDRLEYWDTGTLGARWVNGSNNSTRKTVVESVAVNLQSMFFDRHLVANVGYREDIVDNWLNTSAISNHLLTSQGYASANQASKDSVPADLVGALPDSYTGDFSNAVSPEFFRTQDGTFSHFDKGPTGDGSFGYSGVLHVPNDLGIFSLPDSMEVSFHTNYSKNFVPDASRNTFKIGENGSGYSFETLSSPIGETEDVGVTFSFDNKFTARLNWFQTSIQNNTTSRIGNTLNQLVDFATRGYIWATYDISQLDPDGNRIIDVGPNGGDHRWKGNDRYDVERTYQARDALQWVVDDGWMQARMDEGLLILRENGSGWTRNNSFPGLTDTEDRVAKGYELNLTYNPTKNWRMAFNATKLQSVSSNVGPLMENVMNRFFENYEQIKTFTFWEAADTRYNKNSALSRWLEPRVQSYYQDKLQEGKATNETREWSTNFVTNYKFTDGRFKGFSVGGAVRWQSEGVVGYPLMDYEVSDGVVLRVPDVDNPYKGSDALYVDLNAGFSKKIMDGKVRYNARIHVKNINNPGSDNLTTLRVRSSDGAPVTVRWDPPMEISFNNSFSF